MFGNRPGQRIIELDETDSTNSYAARLLHDQVPEEGTVIVAHFQKAGKGQRGSGWESEAHKNLVISYILYPTFLNVQDQFLLNQAVALSLYDLLKSLTTAKIAVKWPNDILANESKIAGILIENAVRNSKIIHSIIGIGLNVNQQQFNSYNPPATSLANLEQKTFETSELLIKLNETFDKWYTQLQIGNAAKIRNEYLRVLFRNQTPAKFESNGISFEGIITGVKDDGRLEISGNDGKVFLFNNKEVKFLF